MQRQKTIAKWLAVVLLLTLAIGCYIALSAILKNASNNIAGADNNINNNLEITPDNPDNQNNNQGPNGDVNIGGGDADDTPPTYSTFPRRAENIDVISVQHIGGESDEILLDSVYFSTKQIIVFESKSKEYDVKSQGIYLAVLDNNVLCDVIKVANDNEEYIDCAIQKSGLMIVTKDEDTTYLRLYSSSLKVIAQNTMQAYTQLYLYSHANEIFALCYDTEYLRRIEISSTLNVKSENFVFFAHSSTINYAIAYGDSTLIFLQSGDAVECVTYNKTSGFNVQNSILNARFCQVLPIFANGEQYMILLTKDDNSLTISSLNSSLNLIASCTEYTNAPCSIMPYQNGVALIYSNKMNTYCAHLDLLSIEDIGGQDLKDCTSIEYVYGSDCLFSVTGENFYKLCQLKDKQIAVIFECESSVNNALSTARPNVIINRQNNVDFNYSIAITLDNNTPFSYMCFGNNDVFSIGIKIN